MAIAKQPPGLALDDGRSPWLTPTAEIAHAQFWKSLGGWPTLKTRFGYWVAVIALQRPQVDKWGEPMRLAGCFGDRTVTAPGAVWHRV